jgi:hypothetical protein
MEGFDIVEEAVDGGLQVADGQRSCENLISDAGVARQR